MPTINPGSKVLVTGASGFIAAWVVKKLLEDGFYVRGTVRSTAKGEYLVKVFKDYADRFEYFVVEDIAKEHAFDEAVQGVDAVAHTASPATLHGDDPEDLIVPALKGTVGILESVLKHGSTVQRVVITSSVATIVQPPGQAHILTEEHWNDFSVQDVENRGKEAIPINKYRASKVLAERAAWDFVKTHRGEIKWDIATLHPSFVWGPPIHELSSPASLNASLEGPLELIKGQKAGSGTPVGSWVDVQGVAAAHVSALKIASAGGERFILSFGPFTWQDFLDAIHSGSEEDPVLSSLPKGTPGAGKGVVHPTVFDATKARRILGLTPKDLSETAKETAKCLIERGQTLGW